MSYFLEANDFYCNKDYKKAVTLYEKAIESKDNEAFSYYNAGVCYIKLKKYERSIQMLKKAISLNKDPKYFFNLAYSYSLNGENKNALRYFNIAWAMDNDDEDCEKAINLLLKSLKCK